MNRHLRILTAALFTLVTLSVVVGAGHTTAFAVRALAHGQGVLWNADHASWIGNYELDDGNFGYCIDVSRHAPAGADVDYVNGGDTGWFSPDDSARLTFISRNWGSPADALTAAAAQLATWTITGLAGHDQAYFAQRANADAALVLQTANHMLHIVDGPGGASRGASATAELTLDGDTGTVVSQVVADYLAGPSSIDPGTFSSTMTLQGATFDDGNRAAVIKNGVVARIHPDQVGATEHVSVEVAYHDLPFGTGFRLGRNTGDTQNLLVTMPFPLDVRASAAAAGPTALPFRPLVQTTSSSTTARPGDELTDTLHLGVHPESKTGKEWGVYRAAGGTLELIPVVIESRLLGPFSTPPVEADSMPADAPEVCSVEVEVDTGPGVYETPPCVVPTPGYYVWVDSIDPARTPVDRGRDRLTGWTSPFGVATETTLVPAEPRIETTASANEVKQKTCISDSLTVTGLPSGIDPVVVRSTLIGPLGVAPEAESTPAGWEGFPVAGAVTTRVATDGTHRTPCISVTKPGFYYFVFETTSGDASSGSATPDENGGETSSVAASPAGPGLSSSGLGPLVPPVSDTRVHASESVEFAAPPATPTPTAPPTPPATAPAVPVTPAPPVTALARTGVAGEPSAVAVALSVGLIVIGLAVVGLVAVARTAAASGPDGNRAVRSSRSERS
ncbi:hypothetical protein [Herbiconiux daphne]|uniref:Uncharacterized protein n=1 Tax=Herbiconiux daphne TaxID=2970914 RepID=A0ABT2GXH9_9MICO|nr:hypothetical protein [Herbiconiux daphne]MCS5732637.1 hypothetical protein [Herbiconiux daphne]